MTLIDRAPTSVLTDPVALLQAQLTGIELWHAALHATRTSAEAPGLSREARLDAARRLSVRRREQEALLERSAAAMDGDGPLLGAARRRAVIAHRHAWTRENLEARLVEQGIEVLSCGDNGAEAVGVCVSEQPNLVVVDDTLAMRSGAEVAQDVRQFCPHTVIGGYVSHDDAVGRLLEAGASHVFTRRMPPQEVAARLLALVHA